MLTLPDSIQSTMHPAVRSSRVPDRTRTCAPTSCLSEWVRDDLQCAAPDDVHQRYGISAAESEVVLQPVATDAAFG